jgi:DNA invertase Pin-like site-specific DNA recombinase
MTTRTRRQHVAVVTGAIVRVAIYTRISKDEYGRELGVDRQETEVRQRLDREYGTDGYEVVRVYSDNNISAWTGAKRPAYIDLLADAILRRFDVVAVWATDRLYRRTEDLSDIIAALGENPADGIELLACQGSFYDLTTADGRYYARMDAARAQHESDRKSERIKSQRRQARELGWASSKPCFGFEREFLGRHQGAVLHQVPHEVETLRLMAGRLLDPDDPGSQQDAADFVNDAGRLKRSGEPWTANDVRKILLTPTLAGLIEEPRAKGDTSEPIYHKGQWEPIFDRATWDDLVLEVADPARKQKRKRAAYPLRGSLITPTGTEMRGCRLADRDGGFGRRAYRSPDGSKKSVSVDADAVETFFRDLVGLYVHLLPWETDAGLAPTPEGDRVTRLEQRLVELAVEREQGDITKAEWKAARQSVNAQLADAKLAMPVRPRSAPATKTADWVAKHWEMPEADGGLSERERWRIVRWAIGRVTVGPSKGGRWATSTANLAARLSFDGPLSGVR